MCDTHGSCALAASFEAKRMNATMKKRSVYSGSGVASIVCDRGLPGNRPRPGFLSVWPAVILIVLVGSTGCSGRKLVPSPNLYVLAKQSPFEAVPEHFRSPEVDVLYVTDRKPIQEKDGTITYSHERSRSMAFGSVLVRLGEEDTTWEELAAASWTAKRKGKLPVSVVRIEEKNRFPETPFPLLPSNDGSSVRRDPSVVAKHEEVAETLRAEVRRRLAATPRKHAYVFIHGFNNQFDGGVVVAAEVWHFLPRMGVPIAYTWPAGLGGLRGYFYDRESGEFTIFHLKELLRILSTIDELEAVHIIGHSRGTDVALTALRELWIERRAAWEQNPDDPSQRKLGQVVVAAPDLDLSVISQRVGAEEMARQIKQLTIYMSESDAAIGFSSWLFVSQSRVGRVTLADLGETSRQRGEAQKNVTAIDAQLDSGLIGHNYFYAHPAALSDLILLLCD